MSAYDEGWNDAVLRIVEMIERERDASYIAEKVSNSLPCGYVADGMRDMAVNVRQLLKIEHFAPLGCHL